ncbi:ATP-binding cassette domain-containing protein [Pseudomonas putida]|uniref:ATP-binding cassette domain-containing protein n=1 Tax=Pseudomonas putida TaxID=303 RepID=UPI003BF45B35
MTFGGIKAIEGLSLQVRSREITSVIGPNGAGKTTLFNCLTGFYKPTAGSMNRPWFPRHSPSSGNSVSHTLLETAA